MRNSCKIALLAILFCLKMGMLTAQEQSFRNFEQVNFVTDRQLYLSGESVWFVATCTMPGEPLTQISKVLYVDLYNNNNQLVLKKKIQIVKGVAKGEIFIPKQSATGYYIMRAYTRYQTNFPVWQISSQVLSVVNPDYPIQINKQEKNKNQVYFSASNLGEVMIRIERTLAKSVKKVELLDNDHVVDTNVVYYVNGLGKSNYIPLPDNQLQLKILLKTGEIIYSDIKKVEVSGLRFYCEISKDEFEIIIGDIPVEKHSITVSVFNISSHHKTNIPIRLKNGSGYAVIKKENSNVGLNIVMLESENNEIIYETIIFVPPVSESKKMSSSEKFNNKTNNRVLLDLSKYKNNSPVSVSLAYKGTNIAVDSVLPDYLVVNPFYANGYLLNNGLFSDIIIDQINIALSFLESSVFVNSLINLVKERLIIPELYGLTIQGSLLNTSGEYMVNEKVYCSVFDETPQFHVASTNDDGRFIMNLKESFGTSDVYIGSGKAEHVNIEIESGFCTTQPSWEPLSFIPDSSYRFLLTNMYIASQVNNIYSVERRKEIINTRNNKPPFLDNLDNILISDFVQMATTQELFNEIVPFVKVRLKSGNYHFIVYDDDLEAQYGNPLVIMDDIFFPDVNEIMKLQPSEVKMVDVMNHTYVYGNSIFNGIISITTSSGALKGIKIPDSGVFFEYMLFDEEVGFIQFSDIIIEELKPDFAVTSYWGVFDTDDMDNIIPITIPNRGIDFELTVKNMTGTVKVLDRIEFSGR